MKNVLRLQKHKYNNIQNKILFYLEVNNVVIRNIVVLKNHTIGLYHSSLMEVREVINIGKLYIKSCILKHSYARANHILNNLEINSYQIMAHQKLIVQILIKKQA